MGWKHGGIFGFDKPSKDVSFCTDKRGVVHALTRNGTELRHYMRGSRNPFPWESEGRVIPGSFVGSGHISVFRDGNLQLIWPRSDGDNDHWWVNPLDFDDPSGDNDDTEPPIKPQPDKKLSVEGGQMLYGEPITLIGASCRPALLKGTGEWDDWSDGYSLEKYERDIIDSGINYVRHLGVLDSSLLYEHCKRMKDAGIIVEVEVYDPELSLFPLVEINRMGELSLLGNVLFGVGNEFLNRNSVDIVIDICKQLVAKDCLVAAGAWGWSADGEKYANDFHDKYNGHQIEVVHRDWNSASWKEALSYGKPVLWNELFNTTNLTLADVEKYMSDALNTGLTGVQYYSFFGPPDMLAFKDVLEVSAKQL